LFNISEHVSFEIELVLIRHLFCSSSGEELNDDEVADMIRVADEDGDGRINFKEFRTIMEFVKTGKMGQLAAAGAASSSKDAKQRKKK
jgi:hypothetical protein